MCVLLYKLMIDMLLLMVLCFVVVVMIGLLGWNVCMVGLVRLLFLVFL